jgi:hypothetical protein
MGIGRIDFSGLTFSRATFKLTRDSQGAARPTTDFEDFRTSFRDKRDP